ncbi:hypothetical protein [Catenovulum sediminis]|uniref:Uncharacterized protein n=1 Tax=Catenovulum sediminis TaxID=1740262 RepID=A0ABV1RFZ8_9ALTE|nr:hypothetical protein [Catenovulum sediminis]
MLYAVYQIIIKISAYIKVTVQCLPLSVYFLLLLLHTPALSATENDNNHINSTISENRKSWIDYWHLDVTDSITASANWFDSFFATTRSNETAQASARLRLGYIPRETEFSRFETRFRVSAKLPNLKNRWDVIVSDYDDASEGNSADQVIDDVQGGRNRDQLSLALRFTHFIKDNKYLSTRLGLAKGADIYLRTRYRRNFILYEWLNFELEPSIYYYVDNGLGARLNLDFDFFKTENGLWQQNNGWEYVQDEGDPEWRHSLLHYYQINQSSALISGIFANGLVSQGYHLSNKGVFTRYRLQALRKWMYFEIEPFIHYPEDRAHKQTFGLALRLEINFEQ